MSRSLNLSNSELIEKSVANNESELTHTGALLALTGNRTGRSPKDRYIVEESSTKDKIDWGEVNRPFDSNHFDKLWNKVSNTVEKRSVEYLKRYIKTDMKVAAIIFDRQRKIRWSGNNGKEYISSFIGSNFK